MDAKKTTLLKTRGGRLAALIATLVLLATIGIGSAFAAEGGIQNALKGVTDFITSGFGAKGAGGTGVLQIALDANDSDTYKHDFTIRFDPKPADGYYGGIYIENGQSEFGLQKGVLDNVTLTLPAGTWYTINYVGDIGEHFCSYEFCTEWVDSVEEGEFDECTFVCNEGSGGGGSGNIQAAAELAVEKKLEGRSWNNDDLFAFRIDPLESSPMPDDAYAVTIWADERDHVARSEPIKFPGDGVYRYSIQEDPPAGAMWVGPNTYAANGIIYDCTPYIASVLVENNGESVRVLYDNQQEPFPEGPVSRLVVTNHYQASGELILSGHKAITDKPQDMGLDGFNFTVYEQDPSSGTALAPGSYGEVVSHGCSHADGSISFDPIAYNDTSAIGEHTYVIAEDASPTKDNVTNSTDTVTVNVMVQDDGSGHLVAIATGSVELDQVNFVNIYTAPTPNTITATMENTTSTGIPVTVSISVIGEVEDGATGFLSVYDANGTPIANDIVINSPDAAWQLEAGQYMVVDFPTFANDTVSVNASYGVASGRSDKGLFHVSAAGQGVMTDQHFTLSPYSSKMMSFSGVPAPNSLSFTGGFLNVVTVSPTSISIPESDDPNASDDPVDFELVETLPNEVDPDSVNPQDYPLTVGTDSVIPTKDPTNPRVLTYVFSMGPGDTSDVDLVDGSDVVLRSTTPDVDVDDEDDEVSFTAGSTTQTLSITPTPASGGQGGQGGNNDNPTDQGSGSQSGTGEGSITINQLNNDGAKYDAYKVFDADVHYDADDAEDKTTHIQWATGMQTPVMTFIDAWDANENGTPDYDEWLSSNGNTSNRTIPQNVAEFIGYAIENSNTAAGTPVVDLVSDPQTWRTTQGLSFADGLAQAVASSGVSPKQATTGVRFTDTQGYWLFVTDTSTIGNGEAGTAPIWTTLSDRHKNVNEKTAVPVINKQVKENTGENKSKFGKIADAQMGEAVDFRLTSTIGQNYDAFGAYRMTVNDVLPEGMELTSLDDVKVKIVTDSAESDITSAMSNKTLGTKMFDATTRTLTVDIKNIKGDFGQSVNVNSGTTLVVEYKAKLNDNAVYGSVGNVNVATLSYSSDPITGLMKDALPSEAKVVVYKVKLDKVDAATRQSLDGAQYKVAKQAGGWVAADGSVVASESDAGVFTTENGSLTIPGLDEGTWLIHEAQAPTDYEGNETPLTLIIQPTKDFASGTLTDLTASVSGGNVAHMATTGTAASHEDSLVGVSTGLDEIEIRTSYDKVITMPLSGMKASDAAKVYGTVAAIVSLYAWHTNRKKSGKDKEYDYEWIVAR